MTSDSLTDSRGLPISTKVSRAAESYSSGVELLTASPCEAEANLRDAVAADPLFGLGWMALAVVLDRPDTSTMSAQCATRAAVNLAGTTRRERQHLEVIMLLMSGDVRRGAVLGREHLREFPGDILVEHVLGSRSPA